jgi:hypothetical protein
MTRLSVRHPKAHRLQPLYLACSYGAQKHNEIVKIGLNQSEVTMALFYPVLRSEQASAGYEDFGRVALARTVQS